MENDEIHIYTKYTIYNQYHGFKIAVINTSHSLIINNTYLYFLCL